MSTDKPISNPDDLVKSSQTASVELAESELDKVSGGDKAKAPPPPPTTEYLKVTLKDVLISG